MPRYRVNVDWSVTAGAQKEDGSYPFHRSGTRIWEGDSPDAEVAEDVAENEVHDYTTTAFVEHVEVEEVGGNLDVTVKAQTAEELPAPKT
jgi:hypothetical protein